MPRDTGFPRADVENDFLRVRRRQVLARLAHRLSREPDDVNLILPFDEVVAALGYEGERAVGLKTIKLDADRRHRRLAPRLRPALPAHVGPGPGALGAAGPGPAPGRRRCRPSTSTRSGDLYFVQDGHHRVSIALATGQTTIDAYVTEVRTTLPAKDIRTAARPAVQELRADVPARGCRCRPPMRAKIAVTDPWSYAELGESGRGVGLPVHASTSSGSATGPRSPGAGSPTSTRRW